MFMSPEAGNTNATKQEGWHTLLNTYLNDCSKEQNNRTLRSGEIAILCFDPLEMGIKTRVKRACMGSNQTIFMS